MVDLSSTILAKSDQLNADDIIGKEPILKIISINAGGDAKQPINIGYEGSGGKLFRPCKTVRRILVAAWGDDGNQYVGRSIQVYRDPDVIYAGKKVGGIRVRALSHMDMPLEIMLSEARGKKKPINVGVIPSQQPQQAQSKPKPSPEEAQAAASGFVDGLVAELTRAVSQGDIDAILTTKAANVERIKTAYPDLYKKIEPLLVKKTDEQPPAQEMETGNF